MKVLVIDDDLDIINVVSLTFDVLCPNTVVASAFDGKTGIQMVEQENPDLVILDIGLPDIDGFMVCEEIRRWSDIPIIMLSARTGEADRVRGLHLGADDYITKPFRPNEFVARAEAVLRRSRDTVHSDGEVQSRYERSFLNSVSADTGS